jgi:hypothetical protein
VTAATYAGLEINAFVSFVMQMQNAACSPDLMPVSLIGRAAF